MIYFKKTFNWVLITLFYLSFNIQAQPAIDFIHNEETNFYKLKNKFSEYWENPIYQEGKGWKKYKRWEYFWQTRVKPDGTFPSAIEMINELNEFKKETPNTQADKKWTNIGPVGNPDRSNSGIGRVNVIRLNPNRHKEIWLGSASGGVWRSNDFGQSWEVFKFTESLSMGISDIAFSQSNSNVTYVATGDADGMGASYSTYSAGILKTTDNGIHWEFTDFQYELSTGKIVAALLVHPEDENTVIAATSGGIYKTTDGGKSWRVKTQDNGYYRALTQNPDKPGTVLAATYSSGGNTALYRTTDFGDTWTKVKEFSGVSRVAIDFSDGDGQYAYALATGGTYFHSFYKSTDAGKTWVMTASINNTANMLGFSQGTGSDRTYGQGWYDLAIAVSPFDANVVYTGGINIWRTTDGGKSFEMVSHWTGGYNKPYVHADIHFLDFDTYNGYLFSGNDGGIDYSDFPTSKWNNLNNGLAITQYYKIAVAGDQADFLYAGAQDNGTHQYYSTGWKSVYGGDGMDCVVDYTDYKRAIISLYYGSFFKTINGSSFYQVLSSDETNEQGAWVTPIMINPVNHNSYYAGYRNVWKSIDGGYAWNRISNINIGTLLNMAISKKDTNYIYVSSASVLAKSTDGGKTFKTISGAPSPIKGITIDANNPDRIWIAVGGFSSSNKVLMYDGSKWTNMTGNIPNVPVNCIIYQENSPDRLYIGTDFGVMYSDYNTGYWELYGSEMPSVIVSDLEIDYARNRLYAGSYGRGVWTTELNTCNEPQPNIIVNGKTNICEGETVELVADTKETNITWSTGEKGKSIIVSKSGIYSYQLPDVDDCPIRSTSVEIQVIPVPDLTIKPLGNYPVCKGDTINLKLAASFGFSSYKWSTGETERNITVTKPGAYSVVATTQSGCSVEAEFVVEIYDKPAKPTITRVSNTVLSSSPADAYQWYLDDAKILGDTNRTITIDKLGLYKVEVFNEFQCSNVSEPLKIISDVDGQLSGALSIYPNPTSGELTIDFGSRGIAKARIMITDLVGKLIYDNSFDTPNRRLIIDFGKYEPGIYLINIKTVNGVIVKKIIKQ